MTTALLRKALRETRVVWAVSAVTILVFEPLLVFAIGRFARDVVSVWSRVPFVQQLVSALVGADISTGVTITSLITLGLAHPFVFAVLWAFVIATGTRVVAGEIDRGTADLLLTLPVSRAAVWVIGSLVIAVEATVLSAVPWLGILLGCALFPPPEAVDTARLWMPSVNLAALLAAIGSLTLLASTWAGRRGPAVAIAIGVVLFAFLLNFLVALVPAWSRAAPLTLLHYYRPLECVRSGVFPARGVAVLMLVAAAAWSAGLAHFCRRDIPAA